MFTLRDQYRTYKFKIIGGKYSGEKLAVMSLKIYNISNENKDTYLNLNFTYVKNQPYK